MEKFNQKKFKNSIQGIIDGVIYLNEIGSSTKAMVICCSASIVYPFLSKKQKKKFATFLND